MLNFHADALIAEASHILARDPRLRVAGLILMPDSRYLNALRPLVDGASGTGPGEPFVGIVPRALIETQLTQSVGEQPWMEQGWRRQSVLPIVLSTRHGLEFAFFRLAPPDSTAP
jgi:hypothetical protein